VSGRKLRNAELDREFVRLFGDQLDRFAPRCNCGRGPLKVKAEVGRKLYSCVCGFRCVEAR
jgi:hypothetical protein